MWFSWKEDLDEGHQSRGRCARPRCAPSGFKTTIGSSLLCSTISCHLCRPGVKTQSQVIMKHNIWSKREPGVGNSLVLAASSGYKSRPSLTSLLTSNIILYKWQRWTSQLRERDICSQHCPCQQLPFYLVRNIDPFDATKGRRYIIYGHMGGRFC